MTSKLKDKTLSLRSQRSCPSARESPLPPPPAQRSLLEKERVPLLKEEVERIRNEDHNQVYRELGLNIDLDKAPQSGPAAAEQTQEVKERRKNLKAEKRAIKEEIQELEERVERFSSATKGCEEDYKIFYSSQQSGYYSN
ncbi:predicted protein [Aspergillus terreus NIH2624]|uniref:Uncharacterized protein n=1 Tax=Aspergillus terreus (strain NIH 2624 / FGSC A1156) TaxID=341663 RepID=Q0CIV9_ASPTN|nr:uncharacterized protein ATEG_06375 [Aspergillus terreus NIH2624]EAU32919.1 predicted protein [Aspergillus terreus NIH2624]